MNRDEKKTDKTENAQGETTPREEASPYRWARDDEAEAERSEQPARPEAAAEEEDAPRTLEEENRELKEKVLRLAADMDNLRKRLEREKEEAVKYAVTQFARDMLTVSDNLSRALEHVPEEKRAEGSEFLKNLVEGVEMTLKGLLDTFERHGIKKLSPQGEKFDPHFHQAMFEVPGTEAPTGTVVQVVADGYTHHDRVLRPAMVGVAKQEK